MFRKLDVRKEGFMKIMHLHLFSRSTKIMVAVVVEIVRI